MVSGGMKCTKYVVFAFNFIIVLAGLALIIAGALVQTKFNDYLSFFGGSANAAAIFLIIVGVVVFVIAFFGCCGAVKENHCMVVTFVVLLCIILLLEIAAAILAFVFRNQITSLVKREMMNATANYKNPKSEGVTKAWDKVQIEFTCCGVNNYTDWKNNEELVKTDSVPDSCCHKVTKDCGKGQLTTPNPQVINEKGCVTGFVDWSKSRIGIIGGVAAALTLVEIIGIVLACCLASAIRQEYQVV